MLGYGVQGGGVIYGKVASFWLLFSWLMLFPEPGASVRTERQPTDAEILAAFPHGAVEIAPNSGGGRYWLTTDPGTHIPMSCCIWPSITTRRVSVVATA